MTPASLVNGKITDVVVKMDKMWADNQVNPDFMGYVDTIKSIRAEDTATLQPVEGKKTLNMRLVWLTNNNMVAEDVTDICDYTGSEAAINKKDIAIAKKKKVGFFIKENELRSTVFNVEDFLATNMLKASKVLDEWINQQTVLFVEAQKGTNFYPGIGSFATGTTAIPAANWEPKLLGYLKLVGRKNKMSNPFILSGTNLWLENWVAEQNQANGEGKGAKNMVSSIRTYFDTDAIDENLTPDEVSFLIDRGAIAFAKQNFYDMAPVDYGSNVGQRWSMESKNIPGLYYDVHYKIDCEGNDIVHRFELHTYFDFYLNPLGSVPGRTGVLRFNKV